MPFDPTQHLGETVTVRGTAYTARAGAVLVQPDSLPIYISGLSAWTEEVVGKQVEVTGRLRHRPSRLPQVERAGDQYHGIGETITFDDASWTVLD